MVRMFLLYAGGRRYGELDESDDFAKAWSPEFTFTVNIYISCEYYGPALQCFILFSFKGLKSL